MINTVEDLRWFIEYVQTKGIVFNRLHIPRSGDTPPSSKFIVCAAGLSQYVEIDYDLMYAVQCIFKLKPIIHYPSEAYDMYCTEEMIAYFDAMDRKEMIDEIIADLDNESSND